MIAQKVIMILGGYAQRFDAAQVPTLIKQGWTVSGANQEPRKLNTSEATPIDSGPITVRPKRKIK